MGKKKDVQLSAPRIRFFRYSKRMTYPAGITIKLCETAPQSGFLAICDHLCILYPYDDLDCLFARDNARETFDRLAQKECANSNILFVGELRHGSVCFEGPADEDSINRLRNLLRGAFGYQPLATDALDLFSLNPNIRIGSCEMGPLQELLVDPTMERESE